MLIYIEEHNIKQFLPCSSCLACFLIILSTMLWNTPLAASSTAPNQLNQSKGEQSKDERSKDRVTQIYQHVNTSSIWFRNESLSPAGKRLQDLTLDLALITKVNTQNKDIHDRQLTLALLQLLDLLPSSNEAAKPNEFIDAIHNNKLNTYLELLIPQHQLFNTYRKKIDDLQAQQAINWPQIAPTSISLGQRSPEIIKLRQRLDHTGDLAASKLSDYRQSILDPSVTLALKAYQTRHGLEPTGSLDIPTTKHFNRSLISKINDLSRSLREMLKLPHSLPTRFIWINLPNYRLTLFDNNIAKLKMKVIVGKKSTPTPVLSTTMPSFTVNPQWRPPASIIYSELIEQHKSNPNYLNLQGFFAQSNSGEKLGLANLSASQLTTLLRNHRLIQKPGKKNALGKYRFNIINNKAIYLHDTPAKSLFNQNNRALSHGCIRLEKPALLADYLVKESKAQQSKLTQSLLSTTGHNFTLNEPIAVYITNYTAIQDSNSSLMASTE